MKTAVILNIESGDLEQKTLLAVKSIRRLNHQNVDIFNVLTPQSRKLCHGTYKTLHDARVELLNPPDIFGFGFYPFANKVFACSLVESSFSNHYDTFLYLDSDSVVLSEINDIFDPKLKSIAARPDENFRKYGFEKGNSPGWIWDWIFDDLNIKNKWYVPEPISGNEMIAYFNAGVIFTRAGNEFFNTWKDNFLKLATSKPFFRLTGQDLYFFEQMVFSATIMKQFNKMEVQLLDNSCNYPLSHHSRIKSPYHSLDNIKILHYHELFYSNNWRDSIEFDLQKYQWLTVDLPLRKFRSSIRKRIRAILSYQIHKARFLYGFMPHASLSV